MKLDRMIGILSILLQKEKVTAPDLAAKFEVSRRTILRDIDALSMAGIPIVTEQGQNGGISIMQNYKIDKTLLSTSDMQAILAGLRSLDSVSGTRRYAQLMEKLSAGASNMLSGDDHILINLSSHYKETLSPKIELLHGAILSAQNRTPPHCNMHFTDGIVYVFFTQRGIQTRHGTVLSHFSMGGLVCLGLVYHAP